MHNFDLLALRALHAAATQGEWVNDTDELDARDARQQALCAVSVFDHLCKRRGLDLPVQWDGWVETEAERMRREAGE